MTKRVNQRDACDSDLRDRRVMGSGEVIAEALVLMAVGLTWLDHLPRAMALRLYPSDLIDPLPLASIWPSGHVGTIGVISFWSTGVFLLLAWMRPRWLVAAAALSFTIFLSIFWSWFPKASHGANLPVLALWALGVHRLGGRSMPGVFVLSVQLMLGLMFTSAAGWKWLASGFYWTDGIQMQRRLFLDLAHTGRPPTWLGATLLWSPAIARIAGVIELVAQSLALPAVFLAIWRPRWRLIATTPVLVASMGVHFGVGIYNLQFIPLALVMLIQPGRPIFRRPPGFEAATLAVIVGVVAVAAALPRSFSKRHLYPFVDYPMFSSPEMPTEARRLRVPRMEELDLVQSEFFVLPTGWERLSDRTKRMASAHGLDPALLEEVTYHFDDFIADPRSLRIVP